jgi:serine protease Do
MTDRLSTPVLGGFIGVLIALAWSQPAAAQFKLSVDDQVGTTRGWKIGYNETLAGCLAAATFKDQTTVWFGVGKEVGAYIAFTNPRWDKIQPGTKYDLRLQMRGGGGWNGTFLGMDRGGEKGLITAGVKAQFFGDFARAEGVAVSHKNDSIAKLDLAGSRAALEDVIACQKARPAVAANRPAAPASPASPPAGEKRESFGTGFFVSTKGHVLTNHHVVKGCTTFQATQGPATGRLRLVAADERNDLALLATELKPGTVPALRTGVRVGEGISVYGFPLAGLLASSGNFTTGNVTASAGIADDTRMVQISAPVQPGNSGGPLIDQQGNVVGVIVSKLDALRIAKATSDLPQNIKFAIKAVIAQSFLEANDVHEQVTPSTASLDLTQIAERAKSFTVRVNCK